MSRPQPPDSSSDRTSNEPTRVLIIGATSAIAEATARLYAERGAVLHLLGRNETALATIAADLRVRGATGATIGPFEANNLDEHGKVLAEAMDDLGGVDVALVAFGTLADQERAEQEVEVALSAIHTNGVATVSVVMHLANHLERQGRGTLAVITSVAGDRGRRSNYIYGGAKRLVSTVLDGLRIRLESTGVAVVDIRPGFVDTPMTRDIPKNAIWAKPDAIGRRIVSAVDSEARVAYAPSFWAAIMATIRSLPYGIFKRLPL